MVCFYPCFWQTIYQSGPVWAGAALFALLTAAVHAQETGGNARVIVDHRSGTVVITESVRISTVAVAHGDLAIRITETARVSHPTPFAKVGETVAVPRTRIRVEEGKQRRLVVLPSNVTLRELVSHQARGRSSRGADNMA
ncbi:MAG: flagellar basal body P-ring protein FlgI [Rhodospirillales bacterium]